MNVFTGIGRLGRDAEVRHTADGKPITTFAVAIDDGFGDRKTTTWVDCALFGDRGPKIAEYIRKGDRIGVTGSIRLDNYKTRDGEERSKLALRVQDVTLLVERSAGASSDQPPRGGGSSTGRPARQSRAPENRDEFSDDDILFATCRGTF